MNNIYFIESDKLNSFIDKLKNNYSVFTPVTKESNFTKETDYSYAKLPKGEPFVYNPYRVVEPLKSFFTYPKEQVTQYFGQEDKITDLDKTIIFGVKSCDIAGHKVQDFVFLEGVEVDASTSSFDKLKDTSPERSRGTLSVNGEQSRTIDSLYSIRRENIIFISSDCTGYKEVCFCLALEILPHPTAGFDLNLSPLNDGYLVEVGSEKGEELMALDKDSFLPAKATQISSRKTRRDNLIERLTRSLIPKNIPAKNSLQKLVKEGYAMDTWQQFMRPCVECGGCNLICDTCHCFLLTDQRKDQQNEKVRVWDSCLYAAYARVAGGANPLRTRTQRLRNRFMKKFDFFVDNLGMPACCGCGRCIEVCPGKIDIREVLKDLAKKVIVESS